MSGSVDGAGGLEAPSDWLVAGGEAGALIRGRDWSEDPLGSRDAWPSALCAAVSIYLGSGLSIAYSIVK